MRPPLGVLLLVSAALLAGGSARVPAARAEASTPAPFSVRVPFNKYGYPGPWWREGATSRDFDRDLETCQDESTAARETSPADIDPREVAYRSFLDCMQRLDWTRGYPPRRPLSPQP
ncbi:MAG: hypothetical protein QNK03_05160 [Myxococcota bacterium]|nr:hypothetical protein [Myxococcota bacterium]